MVDSRGSTPFPRTVELSGATPAPEPRISAAAGVVTALDVAQIQIQHDAEIEPVLGRANVRDVGYPFRAGFRGGEVPVQMVLRARWTRPKARHSVPATVFACVAELFPHPWTPHYAIVLGMQITHALH